MDPTKNTAQTVHTTIGELAAAYFEAALAEFGDERLASIVTQRLVKEALSDR